MARQPYGKVGIELRDTLSDSLSSLATKVPDATVAAVTAGATIVQQRAIELCPRSKKDPGNGRDGSHIQDKIDIQIVTEPYRAVATVGVFDVANNPYAPHLEFGDRGTPFLRPALDETRSEVHQEMRSVLAGALGDQKVRTSVRFKGTDARESGG